MNNLLLLLTHSASILFPHNCCNAIKKGEIQWSTMVRIILALLLFVIFGSIVATGQANIKESVCGGLSESFKTYIYGPLKITSTSKIC